MTERERQALREQVDQARRATLGYTCGWCGAEFEPSHPSVAPLQRFCSARCRKMHWYRATPQGRRSHIMRRRRWRRRQGMPRRPWAETPL